MNARGEPTAENPWEVVRRLALPTLETPADAEQVRKSLEAMPGVRKAACDLSRRRVTVHYDVNEVDYRTVLRQLESSGHPPASGLMNRIRGSLYQYADTNARENAKAPPPPCCNRPPK